MDWTEKKAKEAEKFLRKIAEFVGADPITETWSLGPQFIVPQELVDALANDLNTSLALTLVRKYLKEGKKAELRGSLWLLGFDEQNLIDKFHSFKASASSETQIAGYVSTARTQEGGFELAKLGEKLEALRATAMETKDFAPVDALKSALMEAGVEVRMSKAGVELLPGAGFDAAKLEGL
jgi:cysteinyl-tRNA synthetase